MYNWALMKGLARHQHFGLRKEWLDDYLQYWPEWEANISLGNRQVDSLKVWLKTTGLENKYGKVTPLGQLLRKYGTNWLKLWELIWVKVVFNFPTARWYVHLRASKWTTTELKVLLKKDVPRLSERTISNAIQEIIGLCERTPIGDELGQGEVRYDRRNRVVWRRGFEPCDEAIMMALVHLFQETKSEKLSLQSDLSWPWIIFGCKREKVLEKLLYIRQNLFSITEESISLIGEKGEEEEKWLSGSILIT